MDSIRHTYATLLLSAGENPKVVSERLGHVSVTLTLDTYSHVLPDMQDKATSKLEEMLLQNPHTSDASKDNSHTSQLKRVPGNVIHPQKPFVYWCEREDLNLHTLTGTRS